MKIKRYIFGPVHQDYYYDQEYEIESIQLSNFTGEFRFYLYTDSIRFTIAHTEKQYPARWLYEGKYYSMKTEKDVVDFYNLIQTELTLENLN